MNRLPAGLHRLTVILVGVALIVVGAGAIAWRVSAHPVDEWVQRIDTDAVVRFGDSAWWPAVLGGVLVAGVVFGAVLMFTAVRPTKAARVVLPASSAAGRLTVPPALLASAAANDLAKHPLIVGADGKALNDRRRMLVRLTVEARPHRSYPEIADICRSTRDDLIAALGDSPVHVQVLIHLRNEDEQSPGALTSSAVASPA